MPTSTVKVALMGQCAGTSGNGCCFLILFLFKIDGVFFSLIGWECLAAGDKVSQVK